MSDLHLDEIGKATGTDKHGLHHYLNYYHELLSPIRHKHINMLEIGVLGGNSLAMWDAFFDHPNTRIWGVDIHTRWVPDTDSRMTFIEGDASDPMFVMGLINRTGVLDFVLDDGSHFSREQKSSLELLWPYIAPGGLWITEDTHSSYKYPWTDNGERSFVESTMDWIHKLNENGLNDCGVPFETDILEITFRKSLVIIKKRS